MEFAQIWRISATHRDKSTVITWIHQEQERKMTDRTDKGEIWKQKLDGRVVSINQTWALSRHTFLLRRHVIATNSKKEGEELSQLSFSAAEVCTRGGSKGALSVSFSLAPILSSPLEWNSQTGNSLQSTALKWSRLFIAGAAKRLNPPTIPLYSVE